MLATISYFVAAVYGAQVTPYALGATMIVDIAAAHAFADWMETRAIAKMDHVPVAVIQDPQMSDDIEGMALDAEEVEERYE